MLTPLSLSLANAQILRERAHTLKSFSNSFVHSNSLWLIEYLFTETVILLTPSKVTFLATQKKSTSLVLSLERYIDKIQRPEDSKAPEVRTVERPTKGMDFGKFEELKELPAAGVAATFLNDKLHGVFPEEFLKFLRQNTKLKLIDASGFFERVISVKTPPEQVTAAVHC